MLVDYLKKNRDVHAYYSVSKQFIWMRVNKVAGISVQRHVFDRYVKDCVRPPRTPEIVDEWLESITDKDLDQYFKFTIVRNPWDRVISIWKYFSNQAGGDYSIPKCSLREFLEKDYLNYSPSLVEHSIPQYRYIECNGHRFVDFIARLENIDEDWKVIARQIGVVDRFPKSHKTRSKTKDYAEYYDDWCVHKVEEIYERDIDLLDYKFGE